MDVGAYIYPNPRGSASAQSVYGSEKPECAFDQSRYQGSVWGDKGMWGAGTSAAAWLKRDLGRPYRIRRVTVWMAGQDGETCTQNEVSLSTDDSAWTVVRPSQSIPNVWGAYLERPTFSIEIPDGLEARYVRLVADLSNNWTAVGEVSILAPLPVGEVASAPAWTLPEGEGFG